ncbi:putative phage protein [Escherichia coli]|nr:putative phage protein [Escherichia coli]
MTTITKERIELFIKNPLDNGLTRGEQMELARIALASLEAEPVAYIFKHPAGKLFWALTDESNKDQSDVIPVYAAAPASVVQDNASEPLAYAYKELTPEIMRNHLAVFERYGIAPNDSSTTIQALRIALDGIERSDAMLHGAEPVSQTYKLPPLSSNEVNDAAWKLHNMLTEHGPLNGRQFNNLKGCFYEALKVAMRNYPVTPDGWISCSERMPKETGDIIVVSDGIVMSGISYSRRDGFYIAALEYDDDEPIGGVTHWMPLPEPPQEVK